MIQKDHFYYQISESMYNSIASNTTQVQTLLIIRKWFPHKCVMLEQFSAEFIW